MKKVLISIVLLGLVGSAGALYYMGYFNPQTQEGEEVADTGEAIMEEVAQIYLPLEPPFVVNFTHRGTLRYLQLSLELMYTDQEVIDEIITKMPAVRNALILLFSDQTYESISTQQGKETLRENVLLAVNEVIGLKAADVDDGQAYFTNFVMQ